MRLKFHALMRGKGQQLFAIVCTWVGVRDVITLPLSFGLQTMEERFLCVSCDIAKVAALCPAFVKASPLPREFLLIYGHARCVVYTEILGV